MNSLIVFPEECIEGATIVLNRTRAENLYEQYRELAGRDVKVAFWGGERGVAHMQEVTPLRFILRLKHTEPSLPLRQLDLIVGLARPQTMKKVIQASVMLGVRSVQLVHTELGDKSYLGSNVLEPARIQEEIIKALEQVHTGLYPSISVHRSFEYFCKTKLSGLGDGPETLKLVAHPGGVAISHRDTSLQDKPRVVALGPERGWSEQEIARFQQCGFTLIGLGARVMRVEIALISLLAQLQIFESDPYQS